MDGSKRKTIFLAVSGLGSIVVVTLAISIMAAATSATPAELDLSEPTATPGAAEFGTASGATSIAHLSAQPAEVIDLAPDLVEICKYQLHVVTSEGLRIAYKIPIWMAKSEIGLSETDRVVARIPSFATKALSSPKATQYPGLDLSCPVPEGGYPTPGPPVEATIGSDPPAPQPFSSN
jgi:hypothetical protein